MSIINKPTAPYQINTLEESADWINKNIKNVNTITSRCVLELGVKGEVPLYAAVIADNFEQFDPFTIKNEMKHDGLIPLTQAHCNLMVINKILPLTIFEIMNAVNGNKTMLKDLSIGAYIKDVDIRLRGSDLLKYITLQNNNKVQSTVKPNVKQTITTKKSDEFDIDDEVAALFDPASPSQLEKIFPDNEKWIRIYCRRAKEMNLTFAKVGRSKFNPYKAGIWWVNYTRNGYDTGRLNRTFASILPVRSRDQKKLFVDEKD